MAVLLIGVAGRAAGWPVATVLLATYLNFGPGLAVALFGRMPWHRLVLLAVTVSQAVLVAVSFPFAWTGAVRITALWPVLAVVSGGLMLLAVRGDLRLLAAGRARWPRPSRDLAPTALALLGLGICLFAAWRVAGPAQPMGAAITAGPLWFVGAAVVLAAVVWSMLGGSVSGTGRLAGPALIASSVVVTSQFVMYRMPTVGVAARHLGIVDLLQARGYLSPETDIYQTWAGLFTSTAFVFEVAGVTSPFEYAAIWGTVAAPVMVLAVRTLAGRFVISRRAWVAGLVFALASSLTTSFYAPQVVGFVYALMILTLLIGRPPARHPWTDPSLLLASALCVALTVTHQISPFLLAFALGALAVFRLVRPVWLPLIPMLLAGGWAWLNLGVLQRYLPTGASFGRIFDNLAPPSRAASPYPVSIVNQVTFGVPAAALLLVGCFAVLTVLRLRTRLAIGLTAAAASPALLAVGTDYGQEGIFRVTLFALPWLAILVSLWPMPTRVRVRTPARIALGLALVVMFAANTIGLTGMDWSRVIRRSDVAAVTYFENNAPPGSLAFTLGTGAATPSRITRHYETVGFLGRETLFPADPFGQTGGPDYDPAADVDRTTDALLLTDAPQYWAIATTTTGIFGDRYGQQRLADYERLRAAWAASPRWELVFSDGDVQLYRYRGERA
ncbi:hypothetical protein [Naumannella huperziae]